VPIQKALYYASKIKIIPRRYSPPRGVLGIERIKGAIDLMCTMITQRKDFLPVLEELTEHSRGSTVEDDGRAVSFRKKDKIAMRGNS
jgi:hypothetical protein